MNKLLVLSLLFAATAQAQADVTEYVSSILSDRAALVSSVLSELNAQTTFSGAFSSYRSDLDSVLSEILESAETVVTSTDMVVSTTTVSPSNAAMAAPAGSSLAGMVSVFVAGLVAFYAL